MNAGRMSARASPLVTGSRTRRSRVCLWQNRGQPPPIFSFLVDAAGKVDAVAVGQTEHELNRALPGVAAQDLSNLGKPLLTLPFFMNPQCDTVGVPRT